MTAAKPPAPAEAIPLEGDIWRLKHTRRSFRVVEVAAGIVRYANVLGAGNGVYADSIDRFLAAHEPIGSAP